MEGAHVACPLLLMNIMNLSCCDCTWHVMLRSNREIGSSYDQLVMNLLKMWCEAPRMLRGEEQLQHVPHRLLCHQTQQGRSSKQSRKQAPSQLAPHRSQSHLCCTKCCIQAATSHEGVPNTLSLFFLTLISASLPRPQVDTVDLPHSKAVFKRTATTKASLYHGST